MNIFRSALDLPASSAVTLCAMALALLVPLRLAGQSSNNANLQGLVHDAEGHPVAGATVRLQSSSAAQTTQTDAQGAYRFTVLLGNGYILKADKSGTQGASFGPFALKAGEARKIDLHLDALKATGTAEFYDEPEFTVAGVSDTAAPGGHGSDTVLRTSEAFAKDVVSLNRVPRENASIAEEKSLRDLAEREPINFDSNYRIGKLLADSGRSDEAIHYLERAAKAKSGDYSNTYALARAYAVAGQYEHARDQAGALLARHDTAEVHHLLADIEEKAGNPVGAVSEYQRAAELDPSESNLFDWGADLLIHRALQPAIEVYKKGNRLFPNSSRMLIGLGVSWYGAGSYEHAVESLCQAADLKPDDPTPYLFLGKMQSVNPSRSDAITQRLARFASLQPGNALANYYYAVSLRDRRNGKLDDGQVESLLKQALRLDPKLAAAHLQLGILYEDGHKISQAISAYQGAIAADPEMEEAHFRLAQAYRLSGEKAKAQEELRAFEQISKKRAERVERERRELPRFVYTLRDPAQ